MESIYAKAAQIRLAIFDVDGVFTDGRLYLSEQGEEIKSFHIHDGLGIKRLLATGIIVAIISGRTSRSVQQRLSSLGVQHIYQGQENKLPAYQELLSDLQLSAEQVAYTGDDLPDLPVMQQVGLSIAVANAVPAVIAAAAWQTKFAGGFGAVREVCELLIKAQNHVI